MGLGAGLLAVLTGVLIKGAVMVLAGWLVAMVGRAVYRPAKERRLQIAQEELPDARVLFASLCLFAASELICAFEAYVLRRGAAETSVAHSITSAIGMALFGLWLFRHADDRVLRFGRPRCAGRRVCGTCTVATAEGCRLRRTALLVAGFVALAALVPLFGSTAELHADIARYALPFPGLNALYDRAIEPWLAANVDTFTPSGEAFTMTRTELLVELRVEPLLAFAVAAWAALGFFRGDLSGGARRLAFAGGALGYVYLELIAYRGTGEPLLGSLVHECAELWFLLFTMELLRRTFAPAPSASSATLAARA